MPDLNYSLKSYNFELPEELVAQEPPSERGASRLLCFSGNREKVSHHMFAELADLLPQKSLLVANNARVVPARLRGQLATGGNIELLLLTPLPKLLKNAQKSGEFYFAEAKALCRPARRFELGKSFAFGDSIKFMPEEKGEFGNVRGTLLWRNSLAEALEERAFLPLPPYIKRPQNAEDAKRYQTIYASSEQAGAIAAPTAGLHFNSEMRNSLLAAGHEWQELTLFVGYGTFSPIRAENIREHTMHTELVNIPAITATAVLKAKEEGRPVVAVGTTSARALEGLCGKLTKGQPVAGATDIFIYPGYEFKVVDRLITNFHLPKSSLLLLVSALAGRENIMNAYREAVREKYRFFSYGDAMLI